MCPTKLGHHSISRLTTMANMTFLVFSSLFWLCFGYPNWQVVAEEITTELLTTPITWSEEAPSPPTTVSDISADSTPNKATTALNQLALYAIDGDTLDRLFAQYMSNVLSYKHNQEVPNSIESIRKEPQFDRLITPPNDKAVIMLKGANSQLVINGNLVQYIYNVDHSKCALTKDSSALSNHSETIDGLLTNSTTNNVPRNQTTTTQFPMNGSSPFPNSQLTQSPSIISNETQTLVSTSVSSLSSIWPILSTLKPNQDVPSSKPSLPSHMITTSATPIGAITPNLTEYTTPSIHATTGQSSTLVESSISSILGITTKSTSSSMSFQSSSTSVKSNQWSNKRDKLSPVNDKPDKGTRPVGIIGNRVTPSSVIMSTIKSTVTSASQSDDLNAHQSTQNSKTKFKLTSPGFTKPTLSPIIAATEWNFTLSPSIALTTTSPLNDVTYDHSMNQSTHWPFSKSTLSDNVSINSTSATLTAPSITLTTVSSANTDQSDNSNWANSHTTPNGLSNATGESNDISVTTSVPTQSTLKNTTKFESIKNYSTTAIPELTTESTRLANNFSTGTPNSIIISNSNKINSTAEWIQLGDNSTVNSLITNFSKSTSKPPHSILKDISIVLPITTSKNNNLTTTSNQFSTESINQSSSVTQNPIFNTTNITSSINESTLIDFVGNNSSISSTIDDINFINSVISSKKKKKKKPSLSVNKINNSSTVTLTTPKPEFNKTDNSSKKTTVSTLNSSKSTSSSTVTNADTKNKSSTVKKGTPLKVTRYPSPVVSWHRNHSSTPSPTHASSPMKQTRVRPKPTTSTITRFVATRFTLPQVVPSALPSTTRRSPFVFPNAEELIQIKNRFIENKRKMFQQIFSIPIPLTTTTKRPVHLFPSFAKWIQSGLGSGQGK